MQVTWLFRRTNPIPPSWTFLIGWAGMRGVVTLAAAFVIPEDAPHREVLLLVAFTVVAGTLLLQGLTLPLLTRLLDVPAPDPAEDALARAALLQQAADAGLAKLDELEYDDHHGVSEQIRARLDQRSFAAWEQLATAEDEETPVAALRADPRRDDRGRARQGAAGPQQGQGAVRGGQPGARDARHRGVDARRRRRGARAHAHRVARLHRRSPVRRPRRAPGGRHGRRPRLRHLPGRRHPLGVAAPVPGRAATSAAATPRSASTRPPTSTRPCTR